MSKRKKRKPMAEINVVPYIDVMLVLLIIFMVSAPLLTQGVKIDLPQASSELLDASPTETLVVKVDEQGAFYLREGSGNELTVTREVLLEQLKAKRALKPNVPILVAGDKEVRYIHIMDALALLSQAGIANVGLMTRPLEEQ